MLKCKLFNGIYNSALKEFPLDFWPRDSIKLNSTFVQAHSTTHPEKRVSLLVGTRDRRKQFRVYASTSRSVSRTSHFAVVKCFLCEMCVSVTLLQGDSQKLRNASRPKAKSLTLNELRANLLLVWRVGRSKSLTGNVMHSGDSSKRELSTHRRTGIDHKQTTNGRLRFKYRSSESSFDSSRESETIACYSPGVMCMCSRRQKRPSVLDFSVYREKQSKDRNNSRRPSKVKRSVQ